MEPTDPVVVETAPCVLLTIAEPRLSCTSSGCLLARGFTAVAIVNTIPFLVTLSLHVWSSPQYPTRESESDLSTLQAVKAHRGSCLFDAEPPEAGEGMPHTCGMWVPHYCPVSKIRSG